jgi:thiol:disulfide interchange protein DsbC
MKKQAAALILGAFVARAFADESAVFEQRLHDRFPGTMGAKVAPAMPGYRSVVKGQEVLFVSDDLSMMVVGDVIDLARGKSLSAELREANRPKVAVQKLDDKDAIRVGQGSRRLYVFADPDCPYCQQLESELTKLHDVQVLIFPFPLESLHPNARHIAESIWCQPDRANAWENYVLRKQMPDAATCDNPIARNLALGESLQIAGTPTLIFEDGTVVPMAIPAARIEAQLAAAAGHRK